MPVTPTASYSLPGVTVSIGDYGLRVTAPIPGPKLTIVGKTDASLGALAQVNEPYLVQSFPAAIESLKHLDGTDSELSKGLEKAMEAGAQHVEIVISAATSGYTDENARWDALAGTYNELREHPMDFVISDEAYIDATGLTGTDQFSETRTNFARQLGDFCYRATAVGNTVRGVVGLTPLLQTAFDESWTTAPADAAEILFGTPTLSQVNEWPYHVRGEDNSGTGLHDHSSETELTGYVSGSLEQSAGVISTVYDGWARTAAGGVATDHLNNNVDGMRAVAVVGMVARQALGSTRTRAAQNGYSGTLTENTNGAMAYAAMLTQLSAGESPTNKSIKSLSQARNISVGFATDMLNARIVTAVNRSQGFVVSKGITGAHNAGEYTRSDFTNHTTYDTVILAVDVAKAVVDKYIGKQSAPEIINAMQNELDRALHVLVQSNLASRVTVSIIQTREQQILGNLDVELDIVPYGEISTVNFRALLHRD